MSLAIVAAKDINQAFDILSLKPRKAIRNYVVEEPEGIDNFLHDFRRAFLHYEWYYQFDPYRETYLEKDKVPSIKSFSDSIAKWIAESGVEENILIQKYGLSLKEIKSFAIELSRVCDAAMKNGYG